MTKPVTIPNTFATATTAIPLSNLDADFSTVATALNDANTYSNYAPDTGSANAYVVTLSGVSTTYSAGLRIQFKAGNANTTASTLNVNGGGAKNITYQDATAIASGTIAANSIVDVMYDGTQFLLMNDPAGATGGDVVGPSSATDNAIVRFDGTTGKLVQNSVVTIADSTGDVSGVGQLNATTVDATNIEVTNIKAKDGTAAASIADSTGVISITSNPVLSGGTANGVAYLNGSKVATSGSALVFDGTNLGIGTSSPSAQLDIVKNGVPQIQLKNTSGTTKNTQILFADNSAIRWRIGVDVGTGNNTNSFQFYDEAVGTRLTLDSSGNLGLGVTPSAWDAGNYVFQIGTSAALWSISAYTLLSQNEYTNGSVNKYIANGHASRYAQNAGVHAWYTAPSGTAGNAITFTQSMTLDASGNLGVGETAPSTPLGGSRGIVVKGSTDTQIRLQNTNTGSSSSDGFLLSIDSSATPLAYVWNYENAALIFGTNNTERARITSGGYFKASNAGTYAGSTGSYHELRSNVADYTALVTNTNAVPYGVYVGYDQTPNGTGSQFLFCVDGTATRAEIRSNGGLANYQSNNVDLSDIRTKTDINPLASYWNKIAALEIVTYKYKDQTHDDLNIGVIAQQVEQVAPEFVDPEGFGETPEDGVPLKTIYNKDLTFAAIKALQEAMARIETLEAKVSVLEGN